MNPADLLRCATCGARVELRRRIAVCSKGHDFRIVNGVIVMVEDKALDDPQYAAQRDYFDAEFATYDAYQLENWRRSYLQRLRDAGALATPLVDVGVGGSGYTVIEAARAGAPAIGCDLSLEGLVAARKHAEAEGVAERTLWVCCSAERLPLASGAFASALAVAVLEHVPDDLAALGEMGRVLRAGGKAWVTVPHALRHIALPFRRPNRRHDRRLGHLRRYEASELATMGRSAALEVEDVQFTGHSVKALQLVAGSALGDKFWWRCERRDLRRSHSPRGAMQLSVLFHRAQT